MNINDFPKAKEILIKYLVIDIKERNSKAEFKMFKDEDEESLITIAEYFLDGALSNNPRSLFDVFDNNKLFINIETFYDDGSYYFDYEIKGCKRYESIKSYTSRKEAELSAIEEAVKLLENA
jgi:hypothetical protein